jgi:hypothetical protein
MRLGETGVGHELSSSGASALAGFTGGLSPLDSMDNPLKKRLKTIVKYLIIIAEAGEKFGTISLIKGYLSH